MRMVLRCRLRFFRRNPRSNAGLHSGRQRCRCLAPVLDRAGPDQALKVRALVFVEFKRGRHFEIQQLLAQDWADLSDLYAIAKTLRLPGQRRMLARLCWPRQRQSISNIAFAVRINPWV